MKQAAWGWVVLILAAPVIFLDSLLLHDLLPDSRIFPETPVAIPSTPTRIHPPSAAAATPTIPASTPTHAAVPPPTQIITRTPAPAQPEMTASPTLLPREAGISGLPRRGQVYALSCEAHIAITLAAWYGVKINEKDFQAALPLSDNPELGFVGDVQGGWGQTPPQDYGVHAGLVAALLRTYGVPAQARRSLTWQELRREVAVGHPVGVWVIGHVGQGTPVRYRATDGSLVTTARFEHTVIVIGYTTNEVIIQDGTGVYRRTIGDFLRSWSILGNMAITVSPPLEDSSK
ncbi:MAG: hypothetical protein Fur0018_11470 [Anaerolineales bacterium]